ncbi:DUF3592 domain-containing protein [Streptomyces sp. 303MFCol5.2]|uniref:DUF3592 domain-containing protein n=1 Tax=Streptomyces sp. 303MFCol5.2 TaxID=1172181 RepID=UPI000360A003|nr:DUF3592 domain-containing protein [Streptomyces sp. 303MFCol5.2]
MLGAYLMGYIPSLAILVFAVAANWARLTLRRRGVRTQGRKGSDSWRAGILSVDVIYRDHLGERHYVTVAPEDLPKGGSSSVIEIVYDPRNPRRAMSAWEFERPVWKTTDGGFFFAAIGTALLYTVLLLLLA